MRHSTAALLVVLLCGLAAIGSLVIDWFDARIELAADGSLRVEERITVTFSSPHHGIERHIPVSYRVPATGANQTITFALGAVTLDGSAVPVRSSQRGRNRYLRIGDPERTILGTHTYAIAYTVDRALLFHPDDLQLYWNVTGNESRHRIDRATASIALPESVDPTAVSATSYVGYPSQSSQRSPLPVDATGLIVFDGGPFHPGEGLTVDLSIPRDVLPIAPPTFAERVLWFLDANKPAALPLVALVVMLVVWFRTGRDPRKRVIASAFAPPTGMGPGEVGVLIDDRVDVRDVSAIVVGLAVAGHLRIEEIGDDDPGRTSRATPLDYRFVRCTDSARALSPAEQTVLDAIFDEDRTERTLSSLETDFYRHLPAVKSRLYGDLIEKGYYPHNPERTRSFYRNLGGLGIAGGVAIAFSLASVYLGAAVAASGLVVLAFSPIMPRKTQRGVRVLEEILGLARYIRLAEVDRIEFHDTPEKNPQTFERLLPYAIALNLTRIWTAQFEGLLDEPPDWYRGATPVFRGHLFALSMLHLSSGMNRTLASAPRTAAGGRSAWGGGARFGGGFSGGGFGGGGTGGW